MVISALKSDTDSAVALKDTPLPLPKENIQPLPKLVLGKKNSASSLLPIHFL